MATAHAPSAARARWLWLHRWLGLALLACWLVLGATGSVLVVYRELLNLVHGPAVDAAARLNPDQAWQTLRRTEPARDGGWRIEWPLNAGEPVVARYMRPHETTGQAFAPLMVWLTPDGAQPAGQALWGREPLTWLYDLHYSLLLDGLGRQLVGWLGVVWCVSWATGLVLWWPRQGAWRSAWRFKRGASVQRQVYDTHKLTGVGWALVGLMLGVTGAVMTWQKPLEQALSAWTPVFVPPKAMPSLGPSAPPPTSTVARISLSQALATAQARFPEAVPRWIEAPGAAGGLIRVQLWQPGEPSRRFPRTQVWLDAVDGRIHALRDGLQDHPADAVLAWMHPLHNGEALGWPGRILVLLSGLAPWVLGVTGVWRWVHKRRARVHLRQRQLGPSA